jgi:hypothetical protein
VNWCTGAPKVAGGSPPGPPSASLTLTSPAPGRRLDATDGDGLPSGRRRTPAVAFPGSRPRICYSIAVYRRGACDDRGRRVDARPWGRRGYPALLPFTRCTRASLRGRGSPTSGMAGDLHGRLFQHFVRRDSSVVAAAAVRLDLDYIRYVDWWEHERLGYAARGGAGRLRRLRAGASEQRQPEPRCHGPLQRPELPRVNTQRKVGVCSLSPVPGAGLEPARPRRGHLILSQARMTSFATPAAEG